MAKLSDDCSEKRRNRLHYVATLATLVCLIDCTLIPCLFVLVQASEAGANYLLQHPSSKVATTFFLENVLIPFNYYGKLVTLYGIVPIALVTVVLLFFYHRRLDIAAIGILGGACLVVAHGRVCWIYDSGKTQPLETSQLLHFCLSIMGSALLLTSNYLGRDAQPVVVKTVPSMLFADDDFNPRHRCVSVEDEIMSVYPLLGHTFEGQ